MTSTALTVAEEALPTVRLHPTAVFSILNSYSRRSDKDSRVIGSLLGTEKNGVFVVTDSFGVPYVERTGELYVAINTEYHNNMYNFHRRINKKEHIIGWYATTAANGALVVDNSSLINEFYAGECNDPIHLVVDTTLVSDKINIRGFVSRPLSVGDKPLANMFHEIKVEIIMSDAEVSCMYHMIRGEDSNSKNGWKSSQISSSVTSHKDNVKPSIEKLLEVLTQVQEYVDDVVSGKQSPVASIGMSVADVIATLNSVRQEDLQALCLEKKHDLLMVNYVNSMIQTQLKISEKLSSVL
jgi:translation initiation factor 3 subunit F